LPWGIPIDIFHRPDEYVSAIYYHPTFLYESIGTLLIFVILLLGHKFLKSSFRKYSLITFGYFILYSILRFFLEYYRIDETPMIGNWRFPQVVSMTIFVISLILIFLIPYAQKQRKEKK
jgi:phosphatidylglycerol:prolipoprotein diacylglycerol transferase